MSQAPQVLAAGGVLGGVEHPRVVGRVQFHSFVRPVPLGADVSYPEGPYDPTVAMAHKVSGYTQSARLGDCAEGGTDR
jgi:hypothetical protein